MKKKFSMLTVAALLLTSLVGCAGGDEPPSNSGSKTGSNSGTSTQPATGGANGQKVTLKLLQFKVEITDKVKAMSADYMAQNPNVIIEGGATSDYDTIVRTRFASGDAPDIFMSKAFTDIKDWSDKIADLSNEPWMSKVSPSAVEGMTVDGKKLGFPVAFEGYGFIYNKDLFAKAGIDKVPTTLAELKQVNEKLKAANILSYSEGYKEWWILGQHLFNLPYAYEKDPIGMIQKINKGEAKVNNVANMNGFFDVLDMTVKYGKGAESVGISYDNQVSEFSTGKTAMMQQGVWTIDSIVKINPNLKIGMFAIPLNDNASDTKLPVGVPGYYVLNKNSKNLDEAKKFLTWLHTNGQKYLVDSFKLIPAFTDLKTSPDLGPLAQDLSGYVEKNQTIPWAHTLWPSGSNQEFAKPLQAYVGGQLNKEQALTEVQKIWTDRVKK
ncbi:ABC transporter substrate-binding protein [Paenibacillus radicis (ex Xue et al. 2023)]|uniref:Extracellular solute-binding protein n=1 Tax=Paenibacillus radicis (ex Xue et al. 2023) TaxID=2972489 RepID=A0ABT1YHZ4_9BACL|nr:extracellular solute-binding protein [Paenibacillus radicis (ex Xue et al. 2023)]MCR8632807.1 extracellular solute-binding protein [Paenibacillus radicis (ex Xue et al. 2023)]